MGIESMAAAAHRADLWAGTADQVSPSGFSGVAG
jgi:hypothetical protein